MTFGKQFFIGHQRVLLWLLTAPAIRLWFRWVLCIHGGASSVSKRKILAILPNAIWWEDGGKYVAEFRTHAKFSKRLYYAFRPLWWAMHFWDWCVADRWIPQLSFGFETLTKYPDAGSPGTTTCDGRVHHIQSWDTGGPWANVRDGAGTGTNNAATDTCFFVMAGSNTDAWVDIERGIFLFVTSALGSVANISAAVLSLFGFDKTDPDGWAPNIDIYTSAPASDTQLAAGDFDSLGTTSQTGTPITYASWSTSAYNDFTFNATGRGNIAKTGISKFGSRNANYDVANTPPTWISLSGSHVKSYYADQTGTANDPKLVVTYTLPASTRVGRIILEQRSDGTIGG